MPSRKEQKEQRRQLILITALDLFVKKGYSETTISDIATAANMSAGLLFHYFESKEQLYEELVRMGLEGTKAPMQLVFSNSLEYFSGFLDMLFLYSSKEPWVFNMFVLMSQARRSDGTPSHIKELAMQVNQMEESAQIIRKGQMDGMIRDGDPYALSIAFWCSIQGIMEQLAVTPDMPIPKNEWILDILKKK